MKDIGGKRDTYRDRRTVGGEVMGTDRVLEGSRPKEGKEG